MQKLLTIISIGQKVYSGWIFRQLLSGMIIIAGLTIIASITLSAMLLAGFYIAYATLLALGAGQVAAALLTGVLMALVIVLVGFIIMKCLHNLRQLPQKLLNQSPLTSQFMDTLNAFSNGLMAD